MRKKNNHIALYQSTGGAIEVRLDVNKNTIYLTQQQVAELFSVKKSAISKHVKNIFFSGELDKKSTVSILETVQTEGKRKVKRKIEHYNLDLILSVGYRVNSVNATKFRRWSTGILRQYLLRGYAINERRLNEVKNKFNELKQTVTFLQRHSKKKLLKGQETEILQLLADYSKTLSLLRQYDQKSIKTQKGKDSEFALKYENCREIIDQLKQNLIEKGEAGDLFAQEQGAAFISIIRGLYQTFNKKSLYPTVEDKAAHLLYLIVKDHPFIDGNKRSAAFLFVYYLDQSNHLFRSSGERKINDNALTALTLLIAESKPQEKEIMVKIIKQLLAD